MITEIMLPASDGVRLYTVLALPEGGGPCPTVLLRTPYDAPSPTRQALEERLGREPLFSFLSHGYAVILQHCRGRGGSEGVCVPYSEEERRDGFETLAWLRTLPHYNGEVYFCGGSYTASVLLLLLDGEIPDLRGIVFRVQTDRLYHRNFIGGMNRSFSGFSWWLSMIRRHLPVTAPEGEDLYRRPYREMMRRAVGADLPAFTDTLLHDRYDAFWQEDHRFRVIEEMRVPVLFVSGWYDYYIYGMCSMWERLPAEIRARSAFLVGPWGHSCRVPENAGYPLPDAVLPPDHAAAWFDSLRGKGAFPYAGTGTMRCYLIGSGKWISAPGPCPRAADTVLYLTPEGALRREPPAPAARSYRYDPEDRALPRDRYDFIYRGPEKGKYPDVLSFESEPFEEETSFLGPVGFFADVSSDCDDTAFCVRVYLVEDGAAYNLADTASTLLHADPAYRRGSVCRLEIETSPVAFTVKKGGALRVDVSSYSDAYAPHANTAEHFALATGTRVAENTLFFGRTAIALSRLTGTDQTL